MKGKNSIVFIYASDITYVIGITYQSLDVSLVSDLLGGLQGKM